MAGASRGAHGEGRPGQQLQQQGAGGPYCGAAAANTCVAGARASSGYTSDSEWDMDAPAGVREDDSDAGGSVSAHGCGGSYQEDSGSGLSSPVRSTAPECAVGGRTPSPGLGTRPLLLTEMHGGSDGVEGQSQVATVHHTSGRLPAAGRACTAPVAVVAVAPPSSQQDQKWEQTISSGQGVTVEVEEEAGGCEQGEAWVVAELRAMLAEANQALAGERAEVKLNTSPSISPRCCIKVLHQCIHVFLRHEKGSCCCQFLLCSILCWHVAVCNAGSHSMLLLACFPSIVQPSMLRS